MPVWWLLSFVAPFFLTPYSLHGFDHFLSALRREALPDGFGLLFAALVRPRDAFLLKLIVAFGGTAVGEVEDQVRQVPDADVVYPFEKDFFVKFVEPENLSDDFFEMIFAQSLA